MGLLRVVVARRGKVKPAEFRLRPGEAGLSLFRYVDSPGPTAIIAAVREAGKSGELAIAEISAQALLSSAFDWFRRQAEHLTQL